MYRSDDWFDGFYIDNHRKYECISCEKQFIVGEELLKGREPKCPYCGSLHTELISWTEDDQLEELNSDMGCLEIMVENDKFQEDMEMIDYNKLEADLIKARIEAEKAVTNDDGGTANLDKVAISLPRYNEEKVSKAALNAGLHSYKADWLGKRYFISAPIGAQGNNNTRQVEAMKNTLAELGYDVLVFYKMD